MSIYSLVKKFFNTNRLPSGDYQITSHSQDGEDLVVERYLPKRQGKYLDIGAHHPFRFSNTARLYARGWTGINIDPIPSFLINFSQHRHLDINLNIGISNIEQTLDYYIFNEGALNTFNSSAIQEITEKGYLLLEKKTIPVLPLKSVTDKYFPKRVALDYVSIDVEGHELPVLQSFDWERFRPYVFVIEIKINDIESILKNDVVIFMKKHQYMPVAKTFNSVIFVPI